MFYDQPMSLPAALPARPRLFAHALGGVLFAVGAVGCPGTTTPDAGPDAGPDLPARQVCDRSYQGTPEVYGTLQDNELVETSGIVASLRGDEVLWMHNDSGRAPKIYATSVQGEALGEVVLGDADDISDLEDIAAGRCPDDQRACLYVFDTGDNNRNRDEVTMYILPEPAVDAAGAADPAFIWRVSFQYEGGAHDVEAAVVTADGAHVYLFEKIDDDEAKLFRLDGPFTDGARLTASRVATIESPGIAVNNGRMITAADLHLTGQALVLRVYTGIYEYRPTGDQTMDDFASWTRSYITTPLTEPQGESIAYDHDGRGLFSVSEDLDGDPGQPLHHYECQ